MMVVRRWDWERLERSNVDSHATLLELVDPQPGESVLDIGTGSGSLALRAAHGGAVVTGIDIGEDGIRRARARAREEGLEVRFEVGDAQSLPYADAAFDVVLSAFGVIFAADHRRAARELARVCRPGGRLGLTLMPMDSRVGGAISIFREFAERGGSDDHPAAFADRLAELLGDAFDLETRQVEVPADSDRASTWPAALEQFGRLRELAATLSPEHLTELRARVETHLAYWADRPAGYVVAVGRRRAAQVS